MEIIINDSILDRASLTLEELLYLMLLDLNATTEIISNLEAKGWLHNRHLTEESRQRLADVLNETKDEPSSEKRIEILTQKLMETFPKGKKEGTAYYWRGNKKEIKDKLKKFFVYFGDAYTDDQIIAAARKYVASFNGDYKYMRLLKYFIWKNDAKRTEEGLSVEQVSDLATFIENADQEDLRNDWTSTLF